MAPPILNPPALKFVIVDFSITCGTMQLTFWCKTDVACHLYLHLTDQDYIIRRIPYRKRGVDVEMSSLTCFVEKDLIEQDEVGDTYEHTFTVPLTAYNLWHYWYLTGTQGTAPPIPMTSVSQIFKASCSPPPIYANFYPHYGTGYDSVDGAVRRVVYNQTWDQIHDGAGTDAYPSGTTDRIMIGKISTPNRWDSIYRLIFTFPTQSIPDDAVILAAWLRLWCDQKFIEGALTPSAAVYESDPVVYNNLQASDYGNIMSAPLSNIISWGDISPGSYVTFTLNALGLTKINKAGVTKLALREATWDGPNSEPPWAQFDDSSLHFRMSDYSGQAYDPRLRVKYTTP